MRKATSLIVALMAALSSTPYARQNGPAVPIDNDDIRGVVTSTAGPEAGVWVIAETSDFQTRFAKIVVTDDRGRYLVPDLPDASYTLWVRGYGLRDSAKVPGKRGTRVNLTASADQQNVSGLGANTPISTGNLYDGVHALVNGRFVTIRLPYPLGLYAKGFEGRIDDRNAGWKGRGLWVPSGDRTPWMLETGKGTRPIVVHFQIRPDPLAK